MKNFGIALICNSDGVIQQVLHNDLGIAESQILGKPFPLFVAGTSFQKALTFLVELKAKQTIFDWELDVPIGDQFVLAHCAGVVMKDSLLILAAETRSAVHNLFEGMMRINNEQTNLLRTISKEQAELWRTPPEREIGMYEDLSSLNNELVTLQRELARKNFELERLNTEVKKLAVIDELTQVYNRRGFFEMGYREVERAKRFGKPLSAILFDIDRFKQLNDTYGHALGDLVLAQVATRCAQQVRKVDILGRYGGEEFSILLSQTEIAFAREVAERVRRAIGDEPIRTEHGELTVTVSIGVALLNERTTGLEELLEYADQALYKAKESGRNQVCVYGE